MTQKHVKTTKNWWQRLMGGNPIDAIIQGVNGGWDDFGQSLVNAIDFSPEAVQDLLNDLRTSAELSPESRAYWNSLTESEQKAFLNSEDYWNDANGFGNFWGLTGDRQVFDTEQFLKDINSLSNAPTAPSAELIYQNAQDAVTTENQQMYDRYDAQEALLNQLRDSRTASYTSDLAGIQNDYSTARTNLMSQQHQQNAQLMDTMQSQMSKQQRNAIEAGASAGLRIAGNINTMLSVQNKQAQQSLDTSNQLAQMLLNQRAAERGLRTDYDNYMAQDAANRAGIDAGRNQVLTSTQGRVDSKYNTDYNVKNDAYNSNFTDWKSANSDNPFADSYYNYKTKSKYTKEGA